MYDEFDDIEYNNLLIVDTLNYAFKYKHRGIKNFAPNFIRDMHSFAKSYKASTVILLGDGGSSYRKNIYPEYKANRVYNEEERIEFEVFLDEYQKAIELCTFPFIKFKGVEADDIAAYIVSHYSKDFDYVWLLSTDKDWDLLLEDNTIRFSYISRKEYTKENFIEHYGYPQDMHISIKVLVGDTGDNIKGIPGIGSKRAYNLIKQYGSAYDIIASIPLPGNQKHIEELNKSKDLLLLNYDLMDLKETYTEILGTQTMYIIEGIIDEAIKNNINR